MDVCIKKFEEEGCAVVENFLSLEDLTAIRKEIRRIIDTMDASDQQKAVFTTDQNQAARRSEYFLNSGDKIRFFYEEDALDKQGNLVVDKYHSLNKIGHSLHWHSPVFRRISFSPKVKELVRKLGFKKPAIIQSMYIFKNPRIGGEVTPHQDATFLYTEPLKLTGLWFAIDEVTKENGCLWYIPGSHKTEPVHQRFVRNDVTGQDLLKMVGKMPDFPEEKFVPVPVPAGGCVLIHGKVIHKSEKNTSPVGRPAYTFHIVETEGSRWSPENWLQPTKELPFTLLYGGLRNE